MCSHTHMLTCSHVQHACMLIFSLILHVQMVSCLGSHMLAYSHAHMLPCSHAYTLIFSHYCMFTCLHTYVHIFGCAHASIFTCLVVHMLIHPFDLHMINCLSQVHMLARLYFTYLTAHMLPYLHDQLCICLYIPLTFI